MQSGLRLLVWEILLLNAGSIYLQISNLARSCSDGPCSVSQSSYLSAPNCNSSSAVDNNITVNNYVCTCPGGGVCQDFDSWVKIDLELVQTVFAGKIWDNKISASADSRTSSSLDGFKIWVGSSTPYNALGNTLCYTAVTLQHLVFPYSHSFFCGRTGRFVFFQPTAVVAPNTNPSANFAEIQLFPTMSNVARACSGGPCPVLQSSYYTASPLCSPNNANDGNYGTFVCTCPGGACVDKDPWLRIDLEQSTPVFGGIITNRGASTRTNYFRIWVGEGGTTYNATANTMFDARPLQ